MFTILQFVSLFLLMLVAGVFWGPWFALSRSLKVFKADEFTHITKVLSANLGAPMTFLLPASIALMALTTAFYPHKYTPGFYAAIAAIVFIIISLIITVAVEVPIVKNIEKWTPSTLPLNWRAKRDRWLKFHVYRVLAGLAGFACFAAAVLS